MDSSIASQRNANSLIHTVTATCRSLPYCDEAAKEAKAKLFSMWYSFGLPSVFFTISPGDECSFRIELFLSHKMVILPQTNMEQNECIADLLFGLNLDLIIQEPVPKNITQSCKLLWSVLWDGALN